MSAVGETVTGVPLTTGPTPWFTAPLPLLNTAVRVVLVPAVMAVLAAVKLVITAGGGASWLKFHMDSRYRRSRGLALKQF